MAEKKKYQMPFSIWMAANIGLCYFGINVLGMLLVGFFKDSGASPEERVVLVLVIALCGYGLRFLHTRVSRLV